MKQSFRNVIRILCMISFLSFSTSAFARDWYVKTTGNNAALGDNWTNALQTISQAIVNANDFDIIIRAFNKINIREMIYEKDCFINYEKCIDKKQTARVIRIWLGRGRRIWNYSR